MAIVNIMEKLNILIACEESQAECLAFRELGHRAFSCDIRPCIKGGHAEWHILGDVTPLLRGKTSFVTQDKKRHHVTKWHLIVAHPPCTYLCKVSSAQMYANADTWIDTVVGLRFLNNERYQRMLQAREFFLECLNARAKYVAIENPLPMRMANLPKPNTWACPSWFGFKYTKKTLYWLRNLPPLFAQLDNPTKKSLVYYSSGKYRSRTAIPMARALALQWSTYILNDRKRSSRKTLGKFF